jgi:hypothetical protein
VSTGLAVLITAITTGAVPLLVAMLSYRQARIANRQALVLESRKADQVAFDTAQKIYRDAIALLQEQLTGARNRITELENRLTELEGKTDHL